MNCPNCGVPLMGGMHVCPKCKYDTRVPDGGEAFKEYQKTGMLPSAERARLYEQRQREKAEQREQLRAEMLMTTCPQIEGYRVRAQHGLVFGEIAFKSGFFKSLSATFDNIVDIFTAGDKELSGTSRLLASAREYAIGKMQNDALDRGANAIIGIDSESSVGGDIIHITIYGTAVEVEKTAE